MIRRVWSVDDFGLFWSAMIKTFSSKKQVQMLPVEGVDRNLMRFKKEM